LKSQFIKMNEAFGSWKASGKHAAHKVVLSAFNGRTPGGHTGYAAQETNTPPTNQALTNPQAGLHSNAPFTANQQAGGASNSLPFNHNQQSQWSIAQVTTVQRPALSIVDQETIEQRAVQSPPRPFQAGWGNGPWNNSIHSQVQSILTGPVSPRESGITPYAALYTHAPVAPASQARQAPPTAPFAAPAAPFAPIAPIAPPSQPLNPQQGPTTGAPFMPMPGYSVLSPSQPLMNGAPPFMQPPGPPNGKKYKKHRRFPIWARVLVGILLFLILAGGAGFTYYQVNFAQSVKDITGQTVARLPGENDPNQRRTGDILSGPRVNILLLGSDTDQKFGTSANGSTVYLAQTDIIVTIDPKTNSVAMLSIPRDFYLNIPGVGMGKLDEAFEHGYSYGQGGFAGAVALSRKTIEQDFGIPINYYAWVGLDGFVKVIDTVNGVDVDVMHPITDDAYPDDVGNTTGDIYAYKRLYIPPGPQHLSGAQALEYVRSRHADLVGDFGRSARQQQVLSALKTKLESSSIVSQLPQLAHDLDGYVKTDMQLTDVFKLMNFARTLDTNKIQHVVLDPPYSTPTTLPGGESIVQPNCSAITPVINQLFQLNGQAQCNITGRSNTGNNQALASAHAPSSQSATASYSASVLQSVNPLASLSGMSLFGGDNLLGFHSLLDLLFTVTFESPQAMSV
jgi:LCP family protein required for cell wall assembly